MHTNSTDPGAAKAGTPKMVFFYGILLAPLLLLVGFAAYLYFNTDLVRQVYLNAERHIYYECLTTVDAGYVYKAIPGVCQHDNREYKTTITNDAEGFRNLDTKAPADVVVIGDSHTHGFGVNDDETYVDLLRTRYHYNAKNLGMPSYATMRELEALKAYSNGEKVVVIQYCDNDASENMQSLLYPKENFLARVKSRWERAKVSYFNQKKAGWRFPLAYLSHMVLHRTYHSRSEIEAVQARRKISMEAALFARVLSRYRDVLDGKKVVVFESAGYGLNHPDFKTAFETALKKYDAGLDVSVLDTRASLRAYDYYRIDDPPNKVGHSHIAQLLATEVAKVLPATGGGGTAGTVSTPAAAQ